MAQPSNVVRHPRWTLAVVCAATFMLLLDLTIVAVALSNIQADFHANQNAVVHAIAAHGGLRPGIDVTTATDILWTLNHPDVWLLLARERGWPPEAFERWLADAFCSQLLAGAASRPQASPSQ